MSICLSLCLSANVDEGFILFILLLGRSWRGVKVESKEELEVSLLFWYFRFMHVIHCKPFFYLCITSRIQPISYWNVMKLKIVSKPHDTHVFEMIPMKQKTKNPRRVSVWYQLKTLRRLSQKTFHNSRVPELGRIIRTLVCEGLGIL